MHNQLFRVSLRVGTFEQQRVRSVSEISKGTSQLRDEKPNPFHWCITQDRRATGLTEGSSSTLNGRLARYSPGGPVLHKFL